MAIVGDLVANLVANVGGFVNPLGVAKRTLSGFAGSVRSTLGGLGGVVGGIAGIAGPLAAGFGLAKSVGSFREAEQAGKKLDAALAATGGNAGVTSEEIKKLAADLQKVTNFEDDATVAAASLLAKFSNVKGDVFKQAIVSAADLSAATGKDLTASISLVGKALNDPIRGVALLRKQGVALTAEQEAQVKSFQKSGDVASAQAVVMEALQSKFGGTAKAMADPLTQLSNFIGDIAEGIGSLILPGLQEIATFITGGILPGAGSMTEAFAGFGKILAGYVKDALDFVRDSIIVIGFGIENFGPISELAFKMASLAAVSFANDVAHFFTATLPTYLSWFADNWQDVMFTAFDLASTVFINIGTNIRNAMTSIWEFIKSGGKKELSLAWTPLTEGFVNTIKALPEVPARAVGELESQLKADVEGLQNTLSEGLGNTMAAAMEGVASEAKPTLPDFSGGGVTGEVKAEAGKKTNPAALERGSKEAFSAIFANQRGSDPQEELVELQKEANDTMQEQLGTMEDIADGLDFDVVEIG